MTGCLAALAAAVVLCSGSAGTAAPRTAPRFQAVAFDAFVLFDPDSVVPAVEQAFPGKGRELASLWRTRQFEYTWLRSITGRYRDFSAVTEDALVYAASAMHVELTADSRRRLLDAYGRLDLWRDTRETLRALVAAGVHLIMLTNFSPKMLEENVARAGLTPFFDALVSTDANRSYKPEPRAYRLSLDRLFLEKQEVLFAAFGGWDAAGAKSFGYPTIWVNRLHQPIEQLGAPPDRIAYDLKGLLEWVLGDVSAPPTVGEVDDVNMGTPWTLRTRDGTSHEAVMMV